MGILGRWTRSPIQRFPNDPPADALARPTRWRSSTSSTRRPRQAAKGAIIRREGLYSSHITEWRRLRALGGLEALGRQRGPRPADPLVAENEHLRDKVGRLEGRLTRAEKVIAVQGNVLGALAGTLPRGRRAEARAMIASGVSELASVVGTSAACSALAVSRATHYRRTRRPRFGPPAPRPRPARALSGDERTAVLETLHSERFVDASPAATYATLLDEGTYLASERTMYRILAGAQEVRERRAQLRHPAYAKPELLATGPNEGLELGHHQAQGSGQVDDLPAVRDPRRLLALRPWLDGRPAARARSSPSGSSRRRRPSRRSCPAG